MKIIMAQSIPLIAERDEAYLLELLSTAIPKKTESGVEYIILQEND